MGAARPKGTLSIVVERKGGGLGAIHRGPRGERSLVEFGLYGGIWDPFRRSGHGEAGFAFLRSRPLLLLRFQPFLTSGRHPKRGSFPCFSKGRMGNGGAGGPSTGGLPLGAGQQLEPESGKSPLKPKLSLPAA